MKRHQLTGVALLLLSGLGLAAHAADKVQSGLVINKVTPSSSGVLIGFSSKPGDCSASYNGAYALLGNGLENFGSLYALVSAAELTGQKVTIYYADNGNCNSVASLLSLSNIE